MTDPTPPYTEIPAGATTPDATPTPTPAADNATLVVTLQFDAGDGSTPVTYGASLTPPSKATTLTSEQYAKQVAETVERTVLLHTGALPVLQKVEVDA